MGNNEQKIPNVEYSHVRDTLKLNMIKIKRELMQMKEVEKKTIKCKIRLINGKYSYKLGGNTDILRLMGDRFSFIGIKVVNNNINNDEYRNDGLFRLVINYSFHQDKNLIIERPYKYNQNILLNYEMIPSQQFFSFDWNLEFLNITSTDMPEMEIELEGIFINKTIPVKKIFCPKDNRFCEDDFQHSTISVVLGEKPYLSLGMGIGINNVSDNMFGDFFPNGFKE
jgi:hypothetical protein